MGIHGGASIATRTGRSVRSTSTGAMVARVALSAPHPDCSFGIAEGGRRSPLAGVDRSLCSSLTFAHVPALVFACAAKLVVGTTRRGRERVNRDRGERGGRPVAARLTPGRRNLPLRP